MPARQVAPCYAASVNRAFCLATRATGVRTDACTVIQASARKSGRPASAAVGTSGRIGLRLAERMTRVRTVPLRICGVDEATGSIIMLISAMIMACIAEPQPQYGTYIIFVPPSTKNVILPRRIRPCTGARHETFKAFYLRRMAYIPISFHVAFIASCPALAPMSQQPGSPP